MLPRMVKISTDRRQYCGWLTLASCGKLQCILQTSDRENMRKQLGIKGNGCSDFFTSWYYGCCGIIQQEKEAALRIEEGVAVSYRQNPQMSYN
jgi:Cys-rich protein (TIGR01571 family)